MSTLIDDYIFTLTPKAQGLIKGSAKLEIEGHGSVMLNETGAYAGDEPADVVLSASDEVFRSILSSAQNPVMAYMSGKLRVEGSLQRALKVSEVLRAGAGA